MVGFDHDPHLHHATTATGRAYLAITNPANLADLDQINQPASLVTLRWPRTSDPSDAKQVADLFTACRLMTNGDACVIAAVRPGHPAQPGPTFADHEHVLRSAAEAAGFTHVLQIVAINTPGGGDEFLYYATEAEATHAAGQATTATNQQVLHIDLLVFTAQTRRHDD